MIEIAVIVLLILVNGVFSGAEIAILSVRRTRLQELAEGGSGGAEAAIRLREDPERFLATVQVGITVVSSTAAAFGGASVAARLAGLLRAVPVAVIAERAETIALVIVVATVSYLSLVLGELVPKSLALRLGEAYATLIARPLAALAWVAQPIVWALTTSSNLVLRLFGDRTSFVEARLSPEELRQLLDEAREGGTVDHHSAQIADRALQFAELEVEALMVPRLEIVALPRTATVGALAEATTVHGKARVLITGDKGIDDIAGYITAREVLARGLPFDAPLPLGELLHPVRFVPPSAPAPSVLRNLQQHRTPLAIVVHETGVVLGMVTVEDLVEELVGELMSEGDVPPTAAVREPDGSLLVGGRMPLHELARELDPPLESDTVTTVGGLCAALAGRIPQAGEVIDAGTHHLEVVDASHRRVRTVRIRVV
jgi:putative hemolysin